MIIEKVLALSKRNSNAAETIIFLHRLSSVLVEYFKELEEESIRDNFVIIYELLDEMMDFGYPQTTESKILQEYVRMFYLLSYAKLIVAKVHYSRIASIRGASSSTNGRYQRCIMAF